MDLEKHIPVAASQCRNLGIVHSVAQAFVDLCTMEKKNTTKLIPTFVEFLIQSSSYVIEIEMKQFLQLALTSMTRVLEKNDEKNVVVWIPQNRTNTPYTLPTENDNLMEYIIDSIVLLSSNISFDVLIEIAEETYLENLFCDLLRADRQGSLEQLPRPIVARITSWQERFEMAKNIVLKRFTFQHTHRALQKAWSAHARCCDESVNWWWCALSNLLLNVRNKIHVEDLMSQLQQQHNSNISCLENTSMLLDLALELRERDMFDIETWIGDSLRRRDDLEFSTCLCTVLLKRIEILPLSIVRIVASSSSSSLSDNENNNVETKMNNNNNSNSTTNRIVIMYRKKREQLGVSLDLLNCAASRRIRGNFEDDEEDMKEDSTTNKLSYLRLYKRLRDISLSSSPNWCEPVRKFVTTDLKEVWSTTFAVRLRGMKRSFVNRYCDKSTWRLHVLMLNDLVASKISNEHRELLMGLRPVPREIETYLNSCSNIIELRFKSLLDQFLCGSESPPNLLALSNLFVRTLFRLSSSRNFNHVFKIITSYRDWIPISFLFRGLRTYLIKDSHHSTVVMRLIVELQRNRDVMYASHDWNCLFDYDMCTQVLKWERVQLMNAIGTYIFDEESLITETHVKTATCLRDRLNWLISRPSSHLHLFNGSLITAYGSSSSSSSSDYATPWRARFSRTWSQDEADREFSFERWISWELEVPDAIPNLRWHDYYQDWMSKKLELEFKGSRDSLAEAIIRGIDRHFEKPGTRFCPNIVLLRALRTLSFEAKLILRKFGNMMMAPMQCRDKKYSICVLSCIEEDIGARRAPFSFGGESDFEWIGKMRKSKRRRYEYDNNSSGEY